MPPSAWGPTDGIVAAQSYLKSGGEGMAVGWAIILAVGLQRMAELAVARTKCPLGKSAGRLRSGAEALSPPGRGSPALVRRHGRRSRCGSHPAGLVAASGNPFFARPDSPLLVSSLPRALLEHADLGHSRAGAGDAGSLSYSRHPNYLAVIVEILTLPLALGAYWTSAAASLLNWLVLFGVRIPAEERALSTATGYEGKMGEKSRLLPFPKRG